MQSGDIFGWRPMGAPCHLVVVCRWRQTGANESSDFVRAVEAACSALIGGALSANGLACASGDVDRSQPPERLEVTSRVLHSQIHPLEVHLGLTVQRMTAPWASHPAALADGSAPGFAEGLLETAPKIASRAGLAVAQVLGGLEFVEAHAEAIEQARAAPVSRLEFADIEAVRRELVPMEYLVLFEVLAAASGQLLTLSDLLAVAASKSLDDEAVLGCVNYYAGKGMVEFDRQHQVVKLTEHGLAVCRNAAAG